MAAHTDEQLVRALVHDAFIDVQTLDSLSQVELARTGRFVTLAELLLSGATDDSHRAEALEILHPSTVHQYLP